MEHPDYKNLLLEFKTSGKLKAFCAIMISHESLGQLGYKTGNEGATNWIRHAISVREDFLGLYELFGDSAKIRNSSKDWNLFVYFLIDNCHLRPIIHDNFHMCKKKKEILYIQIQVTRYSPIFIPNFLFL